MTVTPEMLMAYADGELGAEDNARVEAALAADPTLIDQLGRFTMLSSRLSSAYDPALTEPVPKRLIEAAQAPQVVDFAKAREARRVSTPAWAAIAACLAVGIGLGVAAPRLVQPALIGGDMTASRQLASALDQAKAGETQGAVRLGISFRDQAGAYCRTFDAPTRKVAGLACRDADRWTVRAAAASDVAQTSAYQTASSIPPAVAGAMEAMMAGEPLDAAAEQTARQKGWRD